MTKTGWYALAAVVLAILGVVSLEEGRIQSQMARATRAEAELTSYKNSVSVGRDKEKIPVVVHVAGKDKVVYKYVDRWHESASSQGQQEKQSMATVSESQITKPGTRLWMVGAAFEPHVGRTWLQAGVNFGDVSLFVQHPAQAVWQPALGAQIRF